MVPYFVIIFETFDTEGFLEALHGLNQDGLILVWNYAGQIKVEQCPTDLRLRREYIYFRSGTWSENRWIKWSSFLLTMCWIMFKVFTQKRVNRFFIGGGDILLWFAQVFKSLGRINKTITTLEDWSLPQPSDNFFDWFNKRKIPLLSGKNLEMRAWQILSRRGFPRTAIRNAA